MRPVHRVLGKGHPVRVAGSAALAALGAVFLCGVLSPAGPLEPPAGGQVRHPSLVLLDAPPREPLVLDARGPLAFSPVRDRDLLLAGDEDGRGLKQWDAGTGRGLLRLRG